MSKYTTIRECKISNAKNFLKGLIVKQIPACEYCEYTVQDKIHEAVGQIWLKSQLHDTDCANIADYNVYGAEAQNPKDAKTYTYLSVK